MREYVAARWRGVRGIRTATNGVGSYIAIVNSGDIAVSSLNSGAFTQAKRIYAGTGGANSPLTIINSGNISTHGAALSVGIDAGTNGTNSPLSIVNSGAVDPDIGIRAYTRGLDSPLTITNSGPVTGGDVGILASSLTGTTIFNSGSVTAKSFRAIDVSGAGANIFNSGTVDGFVSLTDNNDFFINKPHGVWIVRRTSFFGDDSDLVLNLEGGTMQAVTDPHAKEFSSIVELERFDNKGLISLQDGRPGDIFRISNQPPTISPTTIRPSSSRPAPPSSSRTISKTCGERSRVG